ncbi:MFS transporter [Propionibacterium freudenreichii]|uniref:MFS transporter n=1 Tax=Propionibacterium freudenreichii TaxID=1744 RepID=UPI0005CBCE17|nr:MFS transporter [Propionibacterium freudenreichii]ARO11785.1 MFS transporter [Propionibacterium freudenreichii]MCQ1997145.1 MHS family MFS transporter [Propionibacterium freudenreichii]MDK9297408.1 MHS family MFS transporter [Propionibacterium freudenreichii]MDK9347457.1 MHS family MFS transporter [Propionibacterium freudenreichii]
MTQTHAEDPAHPGPAPVNHKGRIIVSSLVGTTIEFYDFYIYATAAISVFPLLFFHSSGGNGALLASLATFGVAFVARPLGSVLFGHFGDRAGRKATLLASLLTMGVATVLIGLLPTYTSIGIVAPMLLALMRFCQGLGLGGEWSGASLLAGENSRAGKRGFDSMWPQLGAPFGFLLANGFFFMLTMTMNYDSTQATTNHAFLAWGWRLPFLFSAVIVALGLYVRFKLHETPSFQRTKDRGEVVKAPVLEVFRSSWRDLIRGTFIMLATYTLFYLMTTWILSYAIGKVALGYLGISYHSFLVVQLITICAFALTIPISGLLGDKLGRKRFLLVVTVAIIAFGLSFRFFLDPARMGTGSSANLVLMTVFMLIGMALMGLTFGIQSALLPELFPTNVRYTGSAISYNVSSILGAAVAPFIAAWLAARFGPGSVGLYLVAMAVLTLIALITTHETRDLDLDAIGRDKPAGEVPESVLVDA